MTTLKKGDLIKDSMEGTRKVMETCGTILHISLTSDHNKYGHTTDEATLKEYGYTWDTPAWEPEIGSIYWHITGDSDVRWDTRTNSDLYIKRRDFLGIYQTKELCDASLLEIRRKLAK